MDLTSRIGRLLKQARAFLGRDEERKLIPGPTHDYTPKHLTEKVFSSRATLEGERKRVTILFLDVQNSIGASSGVDAEDWHRILDGVFDIVTRTVHAFEGTINQYTGDGAMALFGAPVAHEDHARRACYAALRLRDELRQYASQVKLRHGINLGCRMGLNTGDVVVGTIGDDLRLDYTAHGFVVGIAARMQQIASPGTVYLAQGTAELVEGFCDLSAVDAVEVKGVSEPVATYELIAAHPERSSFDVRQSRGLSRFVGRGLELNFLKSALERAKHGHGQAVAVVGDAGAGKSRLCLEIEHYCREQDCEIYMAHGVSQGRLLSFYPALSLIRSFLGLADDDTPAVARQKIRSRLLALGEETEERLPRIYEYLGVPDPAIKMPSIDPNVRQSRVLALIRWALLKAQRSRTMVLILEDLQWFDDSSLEIVDMLMRSVRNSQVLIIGSLRPEFRPDFVYDGQCHRLALAPLETQDSIALARGILGESPALAELAGRVAETAVGNPLFIEEIIQDLADRQVLEGQRGDYRLSGTVQQITTPTSIQDVLTARVDRLPDRHKQVLQAASVIGREFTLPVLQALTEMTPAELGKILERLGAAEFVMPITDGQRTQYRFKHVLMQKAVYRSMLREKRARLHAVAAETLKAIHASRRDEFAALIAYHWEAAGEAMKAAQAYHQAAEWVVRKDVLESLNYRHKVIRQIEGLPLTRETRHLGVYSRRALLNWATATTLSPADAEKLFQQGRDIADAGTTLDLAQLYGGYAIYQAHCQSFSRSIDLSDRCSEILASAGQSALQVLVEAFVKPVCYGTAGRPRELHDISSRALSTIEQKGSPGVIDGADPKIWASTFYAISVADLGDLPLGLELLRKTAEIARASEDIMLINLVGVQARFRYFMGLPGDAAALADEALMLARQSRAEHLVAMAHFYRGVAHVLHEQWPEARLHFEQSRTHGRHGEMILAVYGVSTAWLAHALVRTGDAGAAPALIEEALKLAEERGNFWVLQEALMMRCAVLRESVGRAAESDIRQTIARWDASIDENGAEMYRHLVWLERARLAEWGDYPPAVTGALTQALAAAKKAGASGHVARIEQELRDRA